MENIITEFKVIETDDGFRIEIKGDKDQIRSFMGGFAEHRGRHRGHGRGVPWGPFGHGFHPMTWMNMASCWGPWDIEDEGEPEENKT